MAIWHGSVNTIVELQALEATFLNDNINIFSKDEETWYYWDSTSTTTIVSPNTLGRSTGLLSTSLSDALAYWQLEELGQPFIDATANSLDLSELGSAVVTSVTGKINNGIRLDATGSNSGINRTDATLDIYDNSGIVTFNTWIQIVSGTNMDTALIYYAGNYEVWYTGGASPASSFFRVVINGTETVDYNYNISVTPIFSNFVMLTVVWNANDLTTTIFINLEAVAVIQNTVAPTGSSAASFFTESTQGNIEIDETGIWDRRLTKKELRLLYDNGNAYGITGSDLIGRWKKNAGGGGGTDELVKVSANDTTPNYLSSKVVAGTNITVNELNDGANETLEIVSTDELSKVTINDTTPDFLFSKIVAGTNITVNELNDGGNETLEIVSTASGTDELAKVTSNDTTPDFLFSKIVAGTNITINELNDGANETLEIVSTASGTDELVKVTSNDTTPDFLFSKLVAGTNVTIVENNDGGNETATINAASSSSTPSRLLLEASNSIPVPHSSTPNTQDLILDTATTDPEVGYNVGTGEYTFNATTFVLIIVQIQLNGTAVAAEKAVSLQLNTGGGYNTIAVGNFYSGASNHLNNTWRAEKLVQVTAGNMIKAQFTATAASIFTNVTSGTFLQIAELRTGVSSGDIQLYTGATSSIADLASEDITITSDTALLIGAIETDVAATVRLYTSIATRTADARALGVPVPAGTEGLVAEVQTTGGNLRIDMSSPVGHINLENPQQQEIYARVFNQSGGNSVVTINLYAHIVGGGTGGGGGSGDGLDAIPYIVAAIVG